MVVKNLLIINKRQDWQSRLNKEILAAKTRKFRHGRHDCCWAVVKCIRAMTGFKIAEELGGYATLEEAEQILKEYYGVKGVLTTFAKRYGMAKVETNFITAGDICVVYSDDDEDRLSLGIMGLNGRSIFVAKKPEGWGTTTKDHVKLAYRISNNV